MFDPGALGTLLIGLEAVQRAHEGEPAPVVRLSPATRRPSPRPLRYSVAGTLRSWADALETPRRETRNSGV
jgi:hypothetical protein